MARRSMPRILVGASGESRSPLAAAAWASAAVLGAAYAVSVFLPARPAVVGWAHELVPVLVPGAVAVWALVAARRLETSRLKWMLLAAGAAAWAAGDLAWTVLDALAIEPAGSLTFADAGYLALVPLWCVALIVHPARAGRGLEQWGTSLDAAAAIVAGGGLVWVYVFVPVARTATDIPGVVVNLAYPLGDLALLVAFIALLPRTGFPPRRHDALLGAGFVMFAVADLVFARLALTDSYVTGSPIDLVFVTGFLCVAAAARAEAPGPQRSEAAGAVVRTGDRCRGARAPRHRRAHRAGERAPHDPFGGRPDGRPHRHETDAAPPRPSSAQCRARGRHGDHAIREPSQDRVPLSHEP